MVKAFKRHTKHHACENLFGITHLQKNVNQSPSDISSNLSYNAYYQTGNSWRCIQWESTYHM